jgi:plasmid stabilization system protein ParE
MNVVYAPRSLRDIDSISAYLTERSPSGAMNVLAAIKASIDALASFPEIGRVVDDSQHRRLPVLRYPYVIFYRIAQDDLLILHVRHSARQPIDPASKLAE